ncbi:MAG: citrulline utilization hydrolase CtlX [Gammaproteobacteria bacterium]
MATTPDIHLLSSLTEPALAAAVLMVRPAAFGPNPETAATNRFQVRGASDPQIVAAAQAEFDALARALDRAGIEVMAAEDAGEPPKPDAVFPNNWFSTHADGTVVLYPMLTPSRRLERRPEIITALARRHGRRISAILDLSPWESRGAALEGTGALVLDRARRIAYVCESPRAAAEPLAQWARLMDYRVEAFSAKGPDDVAIYHTNVMLTLGRGFAAIALDAITDAGARRRVERSIEEGGDEIIALSAAQVAGFSGNLLHLEGSRGAVIAMSEAARRSLGAAHLARLERYGEIVSVPIPTIERYGGGSVRCMLAEMFLPV